MSDPVAASPTFVSFSQVAGGQLPASASVAIQVLQNSLAPGAYNFTVPVLVTLVVTQPTVKPGITFDPATGKITIVVNALQNTCHVAKVTYNGQVLLVASVTSTDSTGKTVLSVSLAEQLAAVSSIDFHGEAGANNTFVNYTDVPCTARAGSGGNSLEGGGGNDTLYGGPAGSSSTLKGHGGVNVLIGGAGTNYLYGGSPSDTLTPGPGPGLNFLFPAT